MTWDKRVPFNIKGDLLGYPHGRWDEIHWRENYEFNDTLSFVGFERGRSAAHAIFEDSDGHFMQMFLTNLEDLILAGKKPTKTKGWWTFVKKGRNFGVKMV